MSIMNELKYGLTIASFFGALISLPASAQETLSIQDIRERITSANPVVKMYDAEIRSMDAAAKGARSWMPPEVGAGQFMTPYDVRRWKKEGDMTGMGSVMVSAQQMFPNRKKLDADEAYMSTMSSVEKQKMNAELNDIFSLARVNYYEWIILKKKISVLDGNEKLLEFMIKNAEIRYKNNMEKISAYYKARAALGNVQNMRLMYENEIRDKRIRINAFMGRNAMTDFDIDTNFLWRDFSSMTFDSSLFYSKRSDLRAIDQDIQLTGLRIQSERMALKPQFGIRYDHMIGFGGQPMQYTIMGMIRFPLAGWSSKMNKANMESLRWKTQALQSRKEMLVNEYSGMAYGMYSELELRKKLLRNYEVSIIPALRNNFKTMQIGYEQNTEELFMLFDAWETLYMTELTYLDTLGEALKMQATLEQILELY